MKISTNLISICLAFLSFNIYAQERIEVWTGGKTITVPVTTAWTDSGINLNTNDKVTIFAFGSATTNNNYSQTIDLWCGPKGVEYNVTQLPVPDKAAYSLIAKIGSSGTPFYIGDKKAFKANSSGRLYLGYNDNQFGDNFGYFVAFVIAPSVSN